MSTQALQALQLLAKKQANNVQAPKIKKIEVNNDLPVNDLQDTIVSPTEDNRDPRFVKYCMQIDRILKEHDYKIDLQDILYSAIDLFYQSEILN